MQNSRVLLIEDDDLFRKSLRLMLQNRGFAVTEAIDGVAGLKCLQSESFDLIITDLIMPEKEGVQMIREIRQRHPSIKIIAISGGGRIEPGEHLPTARKVGANACLRKPFSMESLFTAISKVFEEEEGTGKHDPKG
jgi:DNA-binding response OmpR family regulator